MWPVWTNMFLAFWFHGMPPNFLNDNTTSWMIIRGFLIMRTENTAVTSVSWPFSRSGPVPLIRAWQLYLGAFGHPVKVVSFFWFNNITILWAIKNTCTPSDCIKLQHFIPQYLWWFNPQPPGERGTCDSCDTGKRDAMCCATIAPKDTPMTQTGSLPGCFMQPVGFGGFYPKYECLGTYLEIAVSFW
jgi:hypothetical protein